MATKFTKYMKRKLTRDIVGDVGKEVLLQGWVNTIRKHGKLVFVAPTDAIGDGRTVS